MQDRKKERDREKNISHRKSIVLHICTFNELTIQLQTRNKIELSEKLYINERVKKHYARSIICQCDRVCFESRV